MLWFHRCCTWSGDELEKQCKQGYWVPVASYVDKIMMLASKEDMPGSADRDFYNEEDDSASVPFDNLDPPTIEQHNSQTAAETTAVKSETETETENEKSFDGNHSEMAMPVNTWMWLLSQASEVCKTIYLMPDWIDAASVDSSDLV